MPDNIGDRGCSCGNVPSVMERGPRFGSKGGESHDLRTVCDWPGQSFLGGWGSRDFHFLLDHEARPLLALRLSRAVSGKDGIASLSVLRALASGRMVCTVMWRLLGELMWRWVAGWLNLFHPFTHLLHVYIKVDIYVAQVIQGLARISSIWLDKSSSRLFPQYIKSCIHLTFWFAPSQYQKLEPSLMFVLSALLSCLSSTLYWDCPTLAQSP